MQLRLQAPGSVKATLALPGSLLCSSRWRAALPSGLALYQSGQTLLRLECPLCPNSRHGIGNRSEGKRPPTVAGAAEPDFCSSFHTLTYRNKSSSKAIRLIFQTYNLVVPRTAREQFCHDNRNQRGIDRTSGRRHCTAFPYSRPVSIS